MACCTDSAPGYYVFKMPGGRVWIRVPGQALPMECLDVEGPFDTLVDAVNGVSRLAVTPSVVNAALAEEAALGGPETEHIVLR